jgi:hypothetical protein
MIAGDILMAMRDASPAASLALQAWNMANELARQLCTDSVYRPLGV